VRAVPATCPLWIRRGTLMAADAVAQPVLVGDGLYSIKIQKTACPVSDAQHNRYELFIQNQTVETTQVRNP
jgi:hypothetical protein